MREPGFVQRARSWIMTSQEAVAFLAQSYGTCSISQDVLTTSTEAAETSGGWCPKLCFQVCCKRKKMMSLPGVSDMLFSAQAAMHLVGV